MSRYFVAALCLSLCAVSAAAAVPVEALGKFGDWHTHRYQDSGDAVCFMAASPQKKEASNANAVRNAPEIFVTHWTKNRRNVVSVVLGYPPVGDVMAEIDGTAYRLTPHGETAWTENDEQDRILVNALQKGAKVTVKAASARGTRTTDTYNLTSSADAYRTISKACE